VRARSLRRACFVVFALAPAATAATWHVRPDGSGDAPTIQAAVDSAAAGDVVELADGTYTGAGNHGVNLSGKPIHVRSGSGAPQTCVIDCQGASRGFSFSTGEGPATVVEGVTVRGASYAAVECYASPTIAGCIISANSWASSSGSAVLLWSSGAVLQDCVIAGNAGSNTFGVPGGGVLVLGPSSVTIDRCTIADNSPNGVSVGFRAFARIDDTIAAFNAPGNGVACSSAGTALLTCSDVFANAAGDWVGCLAGQAGINGNFSADPVFCASIAGNYDLGAGSPCLPAFNSCGVRIGARGQGCGPVSVAPESWGRVKVRYR
jgi:hypothetical protein